MIPGSGTPRLCLYVSPPGTSGGIRHVRATAALGGEGLEGLGHGRVTQLRGMDGETAAQGQEPRSGASWEVRASWCVVSGGHLRA